MTDQRVAGGGHRRIRALILQHEEPAPPGILGDWLDGQGAELDVFRIDLAEEVPDARDYDLVATLGSEFAAFDDTKPFVPREAKLLRQAIDADLPVLGLCFGSQLLARVLGGRTFRAERPEIGWHNVRTADPGLVPEGPWFQWHFDTFTLPPGATLIASSGVGPQAFVSRRNMGLQFHPEVTPEIVEGWVRASPHDLEGTADPELLLEETVRVAPEVRRRAERLFSTFLKRVALLGSEPAAETHT
ncbi:MAG TPA: type 1 glutamine amidotransferase [Polyangiaceae bacterium]|nr:type 1 glutamine amidotransferase [Polyangiaceae bacterium]